MRYYCLLREGYIPQCGWNTSDEAIAARTERELSGHRLYLFVDFKYYPAETATGVLIPDAVRDSIIKTWPDQAVAILEQIRPARDHWYFTRWGMYVGVEYDGYIHT